MLPCSLFGPQTTGGTYKGGELFGRQLHLLLLSNMSYESTSPIFSELSGPRTFLYEESDLDWNCPHSPTSSVRGVFVRSRPNSSAVPEADAAELSVPSEFGAFGMAPNATIPVIQVNPPERKKKPAADTASVRTTFSTQTTAIRRALPVESDAEDNDENVVPPPPRPRRSSTWTGIRGHVSGIFHRKQRKPIAPAPSPANSDVEVDVVHAAPRHKASKFSLRSRAHTVGKATGAPVSYIAQPAAAVESPAARKHRVRRSRSFSGFTSVADGSSSLSTIPAEEYEDLDEATLEAFRAPKGLSFFWFPDDEETQ